MGEDEFRVVFPASGVPGALAVICKVKNAPRFMALQEAGTPALYRACATRSRTSC